MDAAARAEQRVGEAIAGKYTLMRLLGSGGMGAVYESVHQFTQRRVAVKLMHANVARSKVAAERFLREAQAPSSIGHPGIVEVLDGGHDGDGSLYLVLELLEGETLASALKAGVLDNHAIGEITLELLDALAAAHEAGFVHRDIKPENVFLVPDGETPLVKLLDFGIAGVLTGDDSPNLTVAGAVLGTPLYMSPEQALGRRVDARSDLWSVGAVLYQALTGQPPFGGESFQALVVSISTQEHLPLSVLRPDLPVRLTTVVERALHKDPARRWQSAMEMAEALQLALEHGRRSRTAQREPELRVPAAALRATSAERDTSANEPRAGGVPGWALGVLAGVVIAGGVSAWAVTRAAPARREPEVAALPVAAPSAAMIAPVHEMPEKPAQAVRAPDPPPPATRAPAAVAAPPVAPAASAPAASAPATSPPAPAATPRPLAPDKLSAVLAAHQGELERCYQDSVVATLMQPGAADAPAPKPMHLDVELAINPGGDVRDVTLRGAAPPDMTRCADAAMRTWRFPLADAPSGVSFPVVFQPTVLKP